MSGPLCPLEFLFVSSICEVAKKIIQVTEGEIANGSSRVLVLWDVDDTLLATRNKQGPRKRFLEFDDAEDETCPNFVTKVFSSFPSYVEHLLLSQGTVADLFDEDHHGMLCSLSSYFDRGRRGAVAVPLRRLDGSQYSSQGAGSFFSLEKPHLRGISLAAVSSSIPPSPQCQFLPTDLTKMDVGVSLALCGHFSHVFFVDNSLVELGAVAPGIELQFIGNFRGPLSHAAMLTVDLKRKHATQCFSSCTLSLCHLRVPFLVNGRYHKNLPNEQGCSSEVFRTIKEGVEAQIEKARKNNVQQFSGMRWWCPTPSDVACARQISSREELALKRLIRALVFEEVPLSRGSETIDKEEEEEFRRGVRAAANEIMVEVVYKLPFADSPKQMPFAYLLHQLAWGTVGKQPFSQLLLQSLWNQVNV